MYQVAVIGTGNIAPSHIEGLLALKERCHIKALVDIYPEKAEAMKARFHLDCSIYDSITSLLMNEKELDIIHICTPPYTHAQLAIQAMNAKINVLVEKPMAASLIECDAMLAAEAKNGVVMGCIAQNRFRNDVYKVKTILDEGLAGSLRCIHVNSFWWRGHSYYDLWWRGLWEKEGGGCTLNHAVHHIDMLNWMEGCLPKEVTSILTNVMHDNAEVEDLSMSILSYASGDLAQVTASVVHHGEEQGLVLQCEKAKLQIPWSCYASNSKENGFPVENKQLEDQLNKRYHELADLPYEGHTAEIDDYQRALLEGRRPMITGIDGRNTIELITAIYKSGFTKERVTLPIAKEDPYYTLEGLLAHATHFYKKATCIENFKPDTITTGNY